MTFNAQKLLGKNGVRLASKATLPPRFITQARDPNPHVYQLLNSLEVRNTPRAVPRLLKHQP